MYKTKTKRRRPSLPEGCNITANQRSLPAVQSESQQEEKVINAVCGLRNSISK